MTVKKTVQFNIFCDDGRYCTPRAGITLNIETKQAACRAAKAMGWKILHFTTAQCPACVRQKRIPEWKKPGKEKTL